MSPSARAACLVLFACQSGGPSPTPPNPEPPPAASPEPAPPEPPPSDPIITAPPAAPEIKVAVQTGPIKSAKLRHRLTHTTWLGELAWSPDGARLATGDDDGNVRIWDARTGQPVIDLGKHERRTTALAYAPGGELLAVAASIDLRVWDPATGAEVRRLPGHGDLIIHLRFVAGELHAVDLRNSLRRWDPRTGKQLADLEVPTIHELSLAIAPGGTALAMGGYGDIELIDLPAKTTRFKHDMPRCDKHSKDLLCARWKTRRMEEFGDEGMPPSSYEDNSPNWFIQDLAFSADGALLLAGRADGVALLFDARDGKPLARFTVGDDDHAFVALSPDGATVAAANHDGLLIIWDVASKRELQVIHEPHAHISGLAFAPDASALAAAGPGPAVTIWDLVR